jgi:hypothetical protein
LTILINGTEDRRAMRVLLHTTIQSHATPPLPYYYHASTVPTLVRPSFPFPFLYNQLLLMTALP